ncbi:serine/threonine protein kinase [Bacillus spizizenii]|nr:serine/threonine protein kinase [Bacillus spizizenii]
MDDYQKMFHETRAEQMKLWRELAQDIFKEDVKNVQTIIDIDRIVEILNEVGENKALNHTFMPSGGGLDLEGSALSSEPGRIELRFSDYGAHIVEPVSLTFNPIGEDPEWWYYRINTKSFEPCGIYNEREDSQEENITETFKSSRDKEVEELSNYYGEEVVEISPKNYIDREHWNTGYYGYDENGYENRLPSNSRLITRMFNGGDFVIFSKYSTYNRTTGTYDGRHNKVNDEVFRSSINNVVKKLSK